MGYEITELRPVDWKGGDGTRRFEADPSGDEYLLDEGEDEHDALDMLDELSGSEDEADIQFMERVGWTCVSTRRSDDGTLWALWEAE